ncbi:MAG TPA: LON peptidase substrate-binding domain-containing protein [Motilibacterales bacterium]|nr:LON peptidase substrate-binding domain-containing protein [Motilibacterales bacterium]
MPTVPLFPLRTVLVPGLVLPLHIFEPRYRLMISMLADAPEDERGFGIVAMRPGCSESDGRAGIYEVGTMARITKVDELPDGRFDIVTVGARRFSIESLDDEMPYTRAEVRLHDEPIGEPARTQKLAQDAVRLLKSYRDVIAGWGVIRMAHIDNLPDDPVVLSYLVASAIVTDLPERQALLGIAGAEQRLETVCAVLRREIEVMAALPSMPAVDLAGARLWAN